MGSLHFFASPMENIPWHLDTVGIDSFNRSPKPKEHHWSPSSKKTGIMIKKLQEPFEKPNTLPKKNFVLVLSCILIIKFVQIWTGHRPYSKNTHWWSYPHATKHGLLHHPPFSSMIFPANLHLVRGLPSIPSGNLSWFSHEKWWYAI